MNNTDVLARFWAKVTKSDDPDACWVWNASAFKNGYAAFYCDGRMHRAHRFLYQSMYGPLDSDLMVLHSCDNPLCVNPAHLSAGTREQNTREAVERGRFASGDRNGSRTMPHRSGPRLRPERIPRGERANKSNLTEDDVRWILYASKQPGFRQVDAAERLGISQATISKIVRRETWTHID